MLELPVSSSTVLTCFLSVLHMTSLIQVCPFALGRCHMHCPHSEVLCSACSSHGCDDFPNQVGSYLYLSIGPPACSARPAPDGPPPGGWAPFGCSWLCLPVCLSGADPAALTSSPARPAEDCPLAQFSCFIAVRSIRSGPPSAGWPGAFP